MLTKLRIQNFKSLRDTGELNIRPLTFLVGPNSSGKSSVIQLLLMLRQTIDSRDIENPLIPDGGSTGYIQLGPYSDFVYGHDNGNHLRIIINWRASNIYSDKKRKLGAKNFELEAEFRYNPRAVKIELEKSRFSVDGKEQLISRISSRKYHWSSTEISGPALKCLPFKFYFFRSFELTKELQKRPEPPFILNGLFPPVEIERFFKKLFYLGPLREWPKRFYVATGVAPLDVGLKGELAVEVLVTQSEKKEGKVLLDKVRAWIKEFEMGHDVRLKLIGGNLYQLIFVDPLTGIDVNVADIGFGVSQVLPVIIEGFFVRRSGMLLVEQPEIHLHPAVQAKLGDLLAEIAAEGKTLIVETHSEHLLSRIRRRIAEGKVRKEDVAIYYFKPGPEGSEISEIVVNDLGQFENWPEGFFEEDYEEAAEHLKAIAKKVGKARGHAGKRNNLGD